MALKVVEQCRIAPSFDAATDLLLPLAFSDIVFLPLCPQEHLIFYSFQCSESHFFDTIVPNLKKSLSLTLKHFSPLAGKIICPLTSSGNMPVSHYVSGDAISLTVSVSKADLIPLTGNISRDSDQFHDFAARLPPATYSSDFMKFSPAAIQVTLFPDQGICIGITHHHAMVDGSTILRFAKAWASINKLNLGESHSSVWGPNLYDRRAVVEDADTTDLAAACWDHMKRHRVVVSSTSSFPTNNVRSTFVLSVAQIEKLKNFVMNKKPSLAGHVSSFAIVGAHVWTSLVRSASVSEDAVGGDDDESEYFNCVADCRGRFTNKPLPENYFGNCLALVLAESTRGRLKGEQGIVFAAEAISEAIHQTLNSDGGFLEGYLERFIELERVKRIGKRVLAIVGSPRFDVYETDFGWGKPIKFEIAQINFTGSVTLCKSREFQGGVEIGLSMPKVKMDAFATSFNQGLKEATYNTYDHFSKL